jgi:hypothetical protein
VTAVTPANGATGVPVTSALVFVFSQPMDQDVTLFPSVPPFVTGNIELTPSGQVPFLDATWIDDRTLECQPTSDWPANTTITWKLNPTGTAMPVTDVGGVPLATVTGNFTTTEGGGGDTGPKLESSSPPNGAADVSVTTSVVFVFDQAMQKNPAIGGVPPLVQGAIAWTGTGLDPAKFSYTWNSDGRSLTCNYAGNLPGNTAIGWDLNPSGAVIVLANEAGEPLPSGVYSGMFTTGQGGDPGCDPDGTPDHWGGYSLSKSFDYSQSSTADPVPATESPFMFGAFVHGPEAGPAVVSGSLTLPSNAVQPLEAAFGLLSFSDTPASEAALDAAYPPGNYTLRFSQTAQPERVIPMMLPASGIPVPKITNFPQAQAVNATHDFTLQWNGFAGAGANDHQALAIVEIPAGIVFMAPDPCVPRELPISANSILIPANTLQSNKTYRATLSYFRVFYASTNAVPDMGGYGNIVKTTGFSLATGTGGGPAAAARFTGFRLLPNGNPEMNLTGTAARAYTLQRTASLGSPAWSNVGTVTMDAGGTAVFEDAEAGKAFPLFYRAVAN